VEEARRSGVPCVLFKNGCWPRRVQAAEERLTVNCELGTVHLGRYFEEVMNGEKLHATSSDVQLHVCLTLIMWIK
jgi:hypothetical protein